LFLGFLPRIDVSERLAIELNDKTLEALGMQWVNDMEPLALPLLKAAELIGSSPNHEH
jgi:hypothetical protein